MELHNLTHLQKELGVIANVIIESTGIKKRS